jgi:hypothetical protein
VGPGEGHPWIHVDNAPHIVFWTRTACFDCRGGLGLLQRPMRYNLSANFKNYGRAQPLAASEMFQVNWL